MNYYSDEDDKFTTTVVRHGEIKYRVHGRDIVIRIEKGKFTLPNGRSYFTTGTSYKSFTWNLHYGFQKTYENLPIRYMKSAKTASSNLKFEDEDAQTISDCFLEAYNDGIFGEVDADPAEVEKSQEKAREYRTRLRHIIAEVAELNKFGGYYNTLKLKT